MINPSQMAGNISLSLFKVISNSLKRQQGAINSYMLINMYVRVREENIL